jgi:hypothetical protein
MLKHTSVFPPSRGEGQFVMVMDSKAGEIGVDAGAPGAKIPSGQVPKWGLKIY